VGTFFQEEDRFIFEGNVRLNDGEKELISKKVIFDNNEKIFYFDEGLKLIKGDKILTADKGIYYRDEKKSYCKGNVKYVDSVQTITCGSAEFFEENENIFAYDDLIINNESENIIITGGRGKYSGKNDFMEVFDNPKIIFKENNTKITGEKVESFAKESKVIAMGNVEILKDNLKASCDIAEYTEENGEGKIKLKENPVIIQENSNIKGKEVELFLKDKNIYKVNVNGDAITTMGTDTKGDYENELRGKNIYILLKEDRIEKMIAEWNAESIYYIIEDGNFEGANKVSGERIILYFIDGEVKNVLVEGESEGIFYPKHLVNELKSDN